MDKYKVRYLLGIFLLGMFFGIPSPAKAFYLEVPQLFKTIVKSFQSNGVSAEDSTGVISPQPPSENVITPKPAPEPSNVPTAPVQNQIEQVRNDAQRMERNINELDSMSKNLESRGMPVPKDLQGKMDQTREIIDQSKSANSPKDFKKINVDQLDNNMRSMEDDRRSLADNERQLKDMKRGAKDMGRNLSMFEKQVAKLKKQKIAPPNGLEENLSKIREGIANLNNATDPETAQNLMQDLPELMQSLDEYRQQMEMLSRWPQMIKQVDRELTRVKRELTRSKTTVDKLRTKDIDLTSVYQSFTEAVDKLKAVRDDAASKIAAGDAEEAFEVLENDFFGQMEDVWEQQRVISMMSNLGRFTSEFNKGLKQVKNEIAQLKKKKLDTSGLEDIQSQMVEKGQEIKELLKTTPIDEDAIMDVLQELENFKQEFENRGDELTGEDDDSPLKSGGQKIQGVEIPSTLNKFIKK